MTYDNFKLKSLVKDEEFQEIILLIQKDNTIIFNFMDFLDDEDFKVRENALIALQEGILTVDTVKTLQEIEHNLLPRILDMLADPIANVRVEAVNLVFNIESDLGVLENIIAQLLKISYELLREDFSLHIQRSAAGELQKAAFWFLDTKKDYEKSLEIRSRLARNKDKIIRNNAIFFPQHIRNKYPEEIKKMEPLLNEIAENTIRELEM